MDEEMTRAEFKTLMEMVLMILKGCKDLEEAIKKIESLSIFHDKG